MSRFLHLIGLWITKPTQYITVVYLVIPVLALVEIFEYFKKSKGMKFGILLGSATAQFGVGVKNFGPNFGN